MVNEWQWYKLPAKRWQEHNGEGDHSWRDSQKQKLYDAEQILRYHFKEINTEFKSIKEIEYYVGQLLKSAWII